MTFLSTSLQQGSGLSGKWRGGNVCFKMFKLCFLDIIIIILAFPKTNWNLLVFILDFFL